MFTCNVQLAGYEFSQADNQGAIDLDEFFAFCSKFSLGGTVAPLSNNQGRSIRNSVGSRYPENTILWISIAGTKKEPIYLVGYVYMKPVKKFWMPGKIRLKKWVDIFSLYTLDDTIPLFKLFFAGEDEKLFATLSTKEKFDSMLAVKY